MNIIWTQVGFPLARRQMDLYTSPNPGLPQTGQVNTLTRTPSNNVIDQRPVVERRNVSQGRPGEAGFPVASFLLHQGNTSAVIFRVKQELQRIDGQVRRVMANHRYGGMLAVVDVQLRFDPHNAVHVTGVLEGGAPYAYDRPVRNYGPESRSFGGLWLEAGVYAEPEHAISVYRAAQRRHGEVRSSGGRFRHNEQWFFWGVWDGA